ncbi:MAG TPA: NAD(P)-dependent oxidoreductase, partial [Acidobacteriaceae bacterium]|nr:NAD(P)-dependent oxidoreductase [Acidobacteriaceae bacterium]
MRVAVLGMGAMGSRMAISLLRAGHSVVVWNRTPDRTKPLIEQGATAATSPFEAAKHADLVLSVVRDNEASRRVWLSPDDGALKSMSDKAIGVESSTLTPNWTRELASAFAARGVPFLDAPVVGTRAQADTVTLIHLVGGDASTLARAQPVLSAIGNVAHHVGAAGSGAALKLLVNALLAIQVATIGELLGAAERLGLDRRRAGEVIA